MYLLPDHYVYIGLLLTTTRNVCLKPKIDFKKESILIVLIILVYVDQTTYNAGTDSDAAKPKVVLGKSGPKLSTRRAGLVQKPKHAPIESTRLGESFV